MVKIATRDKRAKGRTRSPNRYLSATPRGRLAVRVWNNRTIYFLIIPIMVMFVIFNYIPMAGIFMAFNDFKLNRGFMGIFTSPWVGLKHFNRLFGNPYIFKVLFNTLSLSLLKLVFVFPAPIIFAILLNELKNLRFKRVIQTITYLPNFLSAVVVVGLVQGLLSPTYGIVNAIRDALGLNTIHYLASANYFRGILVGADLWKSFGWGAIVYLAAITSIDSELYEAAMIDGAGRFRRIWHITLPGMKSVIALYLILNIGYILSASFDMVFLLKSDSVMSVADTVELYAYRMGMQGSSYSFGAAIGLFQGVVGLILVSLSNFAAKKMDTPGIW